MPVLAIWGANDYHVDPNLGAKAYEEIPRLNGNPDVTIKVFDGGGPSLMIADEEGYSDFAPGYISTMGEWLEARR